MNRAQSVCNYAILRFRPYAETEEFVNVGVLVACAEPCLLRFAAQTSMPARAKALFPKQDEDAFASALNGLMLEMRRLEAEAHEPKRVQMAFIETVRIRESVFRFGDIRTILTGDPEHLADELFRRYVLMRKWDRARASRTLFKRGRQRAVSRAR